MMGFFSRLLGQHKKESQPKSERGPVVTRLVCLIPRPIQPRMPITGSLQRTRQATKSQATPNGGPLGQGDIYGVNGTSENIDEAGYLFSSSLRFFFFWRFRLLPVVSVKRIGLSDWRHGNGLLQKTTKQLPTT